MRGNAYSNILSVSQVGHTRQFLGESPNGVLASLLSGNWLLFSFEIVVRSALSNYAISKFISKTIGPLPKKKSTRQRAQLTVPEVALFFHFFLEKKISILPPP